MNLHESLKWRMTEAAMDVVRASTTPIFRKRGQEGEQQGTGTFFQIGEHKLLVTAAHVLDGFGDGWYPMLADAGGDDERLQPVPMAGRSDAFDDPADVAVVILDRQTTDALPGRRYLTLADVDVGTIYPGAFVLGGFPNLLGMESDQPTDLNGCVACTKLYTGPTSMIESYDAQWHILLDRMEEDGCEDSDGHITMLPDSLRGASGSPVFQTFRNGNKFADWLPQDIRVIGVAIEDRRQAITVTRWAAVLACAYNCFPELRSDIEAMGMVPDKVPMPAVIYG